MHVGLLFGRLGILRNQVGVIDQHRRRRQGGLAANSGGLRRVEIKGVVHGRPVHVSQRGLRAVGIGKGGVAVAKGDVPLAAVVGQLFDVGLADELGQRHFMRLTLVGGLLLPLLLHLLLLEGQNVIVNLLGLGRGSEDFEGVIFKSLDPGTDIGRVLAGIVTDSQLVAQDHRGDFGAQLFLGVPLTSERMGQVAV